MFLGVREEVALKSPAADRPVEVLRRPDVCRGAQLAPGPLVFGAAAPSVAVGLLAERVGHGVDPGDTEQRLQSSIRCSIITAARDSQSPISLLINRVG